MLVLEGWARDGLIHEQIAKNIGVSDGTLYDWEKRFPEISEAIKKGRAPVDIQVENALLKRALGYDWTETTEEAYGDGKKHIKRVNRHVPPEPSALIFWLRNRKPKYWRQNPDAPQANDDPLIKYLNKIAKEAEDAESKAN